MPHREKRLSVAAVGVLWTAVIELISTQLERCLQLHLREQRSTDQDREIVMQVIYLSTTLTSRLQRLLERRDEDLSQYMEERGLKSENLRCAAALERPMEPALEAAIMVGSSQSRDRLWSLSSITSASRAAAAYPFASGASKLQRFSQYVNGEYASAFDQSRLSASATDQKFNAMDLNHDGVVDREEFHIGYRRS